MRESAIALMIIGSILLFMTLMVIIGTTIGTLYAMLFIGIVILLTGIILYRKTQL